MMRSQPGIDNLHNAIKMSQDLNFPRQGAVYLSRALKQSDDTKPRPVVVISTDIRNRFSSTILVIPFSSDIQNSAANPARVFVPAGEGGLTRDSYAMCDLITTIAKRYLEQDSYGQLSPKYIQRLQQGIQIAIGDS
jgi:mRNA interferase MazF